jgi:hypothetical protein
MEYSPESGCPGHRRPSQRATNPRQYWGKRAKKNQPRVVGFLNSGGAGRNRTAVRKSSTDSSTYLALLFNFMLQTRAGALLQHELPIV